MKSIPRKELTLFDSTSLIVGIIVGAGIYQTAPDVAKAVGSPWALFGLWVLGGLISLLGALCYAELASAYPEEGGDYVYLGRAYGRPAGFLFGWSQLLIIRPGDIASMAFVFANYGARFTGHDDSSYQLQLALGGVVVLTAVNISGVKQGKWTQNLLTLLKAAGLLAIWGVALSVRSPDGLASDVSIEPTRPFQLAMILILFTYGGWNEMAYVAAEIRDPQKNIVRALVLGTAVVTLLYVLVNMAFVMVLGLSGTAASEAVAVDTVSQALPIAGDRLIALLVCVSAFGALNGLVLTGARISYAMGADHRLFRAVGVWNAARGTPVRALILQGVIAALIIVVFQRFEKTVLYTAMATYLFYLATSLSVLVLRYIDRDRPRPYRVIGYPFTPICFALICGFMVYSAYVYDPVAAWITLSILGVGGVVYVLTQRLSSARSDPPVD